MSKFVLNHRLTGGLRLLLIVAAAWLELASTSAQATPGTPTGLATAFTTNGVRLSWLPPSPSATFTFNVRVGGSPGSSNVAFQSVGSQTSFFLPLAPPPIGPIAPHYYWSVQAVDSGQTPGLFAAEQTFVLAAIPEIIYIERATTGVALLFFRGSNQATYTVESSEDLLHWTELGQVSDPGTEVYFFGDANAPPIPFRFYRVKYP